MRSGIHAIHQSYPYSPHDGLGERGAGADFALAR